MRLAGIEIPDAEILELADRLRSGGFTDLGDRLEDAWHREVRIFGLSVAEREMLLRSLEDGPGAFVGLRAALVNDHRERAELGL